MSKRCIHCKSGHVDKTGANEWTCYECLSKWGQGKKRTQPVFECKASEHIPTIPPFIHSPFKSPPRAKTDKSYRE